MNTATITPINKMVATVKFNEGGKIRDDIIIGDYGQAMRKLANAGYRVIVEWKNGK